MKNALALATLASCVASLCQAAGPPVPENLLVCSRVQDPMERVKCYDTQIEAMKSQSSAAASPAVPAPVSPSPRAPSAAVAATSPPAVSSSAGAATATLPSRSPTSAEASQPRPPSPSVSSPASAEAAAAGSAAGSAQSSPPQSPEARFGSELLPPGERPTISAKESELISQITTLQLVRPNIVSFSLANGQVWLQEQADPKALFFRIGQGAHIQKSALGSYHLWTADVGEKNWVRVRRMR